MSTTVAQEVDLRGLSRAAAIVTTGQILQDCESGDLVEVLATDSATPDGFTAWCRATGNELLATSLSGAVYRVVIRKS